MMKPGMMFSLAIACACCVLCAGCYESKYPLSAPEIPIDARLVGSWIEQSQNSIEGGRRTRKVCINKFSDREYLAAFSTGDEAASLARAFISRIDGVNVLNLQGIESLDPADRTFVFFQYGFSADGCLEARIVSGDSPLLKDRTFPSQRELAACIRKNIHDPRLFGDMVRFKPASGMDMKLFP